MKICVVIKCENIKDVYPFINRVKGQCSLLELRLDFLKSWTPQDLLKIKNYTDIPFIFTLRTKKQGGQFQGIVDYQTLAQARPAYLDIEFPSQPPQSDSKIILSFHDFEHMPDLQKLTQQMQKIPADLYKIAVTLKTSTEALQLLHFMRKNNVLAMGMGKCGEPTRILAPIFGGQFVYASLDTQSSTAPGQLTVQELNEIYHYSSLSPTTSIYGLIGNPIDMSVGHIIHNEFYRNSGLDCVYVKFPTNREELPEFLAWAKKVGIKGLSVTMPLKEEIMPFLDSISDDAAKIGAVNTLVFEDDQIIGYNTDGNGALDAIESKLKVKGKTIVIIGAGGATKAVAVTAMNRGANVIVLNRNESRARSLAERIGCRHGSLDSLPRIHYDLIINATPNPMPIDPQWILPSKAVMDLTTRPAHTTFMQEGEKKGCLLIYGYEMFLNQAKGQINLWFKNKPENNYFVETGLAASFNPMKK